MGARAWRKTQHRLVMSWTRFWQGIYGFQVPYRRFSLDDIGRSQTPRYKTAGPGRFGYWVEDYRDLYKKAKYPFLFYNL
jgi:hypothetical protein